MKHTLIAPTYIDLPRVTKKDKRIQLNLNVYRNLHYILSNQAKIAFKEQMKEQISCLPELKAPKITYELYLDKHIRCDLANKLVIVDKFFCDALTEFGKIADDDVTHIKTITYQFGGYNKTPCVTIYIEDIKS